MSAVVANLIRHIQARRCIIKQPIVNAQIDLTIGDGGEGLSSIAVTGAGLRSMSERIKALEIVFTLAISNSRGAQINAHLPVVVSAFPKLFVSTKEEVV